MNTKRTILLALVLAIAAGCLASCVDIAGELPDSTTEPTGEYTSEELTDELSSAFSAGSKTAAVPKTTAGPKATAAARPAVPEDSSVSSENRAKKTKTGSAFFDDAVFVGDSVTLALKNNATAQRNAGKSYLGKAKFLASGSLSYTNSSWSLDHPKSVHPKVKGKKVTLEDGVKMLGGKKVFIMLGMNDFAAYNNDKVIKTAVSQIKKIIAKSPGIQVYIQSVTPITADKQHGSFNNKNVDAFNKRLAAMCEQNGWTYVDINSRFKDENGNLNPAYCGDPNGMGIHMTKKGCDVWVDYLTETFAK